MNQPLVSVITPTYNCAPFIRETIDSVLHQDYKDLGYFITDDGSTDGTWDLLIDFYKKNRKYDEILGLAHHANIGEQKTINQLLVVVECKYFMIVNADDPLLPGAISTLVEFMEAHPSVLCAYPDWNAINEDGTLRARIKSRDYDFAYMVRHHTCLPSVGSMFRREVLDVVGYRDTSFRWLGDFDYWLRVGLAGEMAHVPITLATWRHRNGQASQQKQDTRAGEHVRLMQKFYSLPQLPASLLRVKSEAICWSYLVAASVCESKAASLKYISKAIASYPHLLWQLEFYDALARRAYYILRR